MKAALALLCAPVLCAVLCSCAGGGKPAAGTGPYWPTRGWRTSDPRAQGMDGGMLERGISKILLDKRFPFNGMVVVRHGYIVKEVYFPPYNADTPHELYSCTKSFTSALVGIAIDAGFIKSAQEPALPLLPPRGGGAADRGLRSMTLKDLLTMSSGLQWTEDDSTLARLFMGRMGRDWVSYILNSPAAFAPGSGFLFSFGDSHLLSAIIQRSTGMKASQFARERLFRPLGITDVSWEEDPSGVTIGGTWRSSATSTCAKENGRESRSYPRGG
jgi:CubicO group peptidase (beta-lactamase class C family)